MKGKFTALAVLVSIAVIAFLVLTGCAGPWASLTPLDLGNPGPSETPRTVLASEGWCPDCDCDGSSTTATNDVVTIAPHTLDPANPTEQPQKFYVVLRGELQQQEAEPAVAQEPEPRPGSGTHVPEPPWKVSTLYSMYRDRTIAVAVIVAVKARFRGLENSSSRTSPAQERVLESVPGQRPCDEGLPIQQARLQEPPALSMGVVW